MAFALPPLGLVAALAIAVVQSPQAFALRLLVPLFAYAMLALLAVHAAWRVAALLDGWRLSRQLSGAEVPAPRRDPSFALTVGLGFLLVVGHAAAGLYIHSFSVAAAPMFRSADDLVDRLGPGTHSGADDVPAPIDDRPPSEGAPPQARTGLPADHDGRLTVLIVGIDSAPGRGQALTDTLIIASYEIETNRVTMISIPRDVSRMPIYNDAPYAGKINGFLSHARRNADIFPEGPMPALVRQVEHLIGVDIDYYAATDMAGLEQIVDMVGGVTVTLERPIRDHFWDFYMEPGEHHLDGPTAMIYVRSRFGRGNSDFERARRQQDVVRALVQRGRDPGLLARLPQVLSAAAEMIRTDMPPERLPELLSMLDQLAAAETQQIVLRPTRFAQRIPAEETGGAYMIELKMDEVAELSLELFGDDSHYHEDRSQQTLDQKG
jgi:LCP family protein required for cell wall assembly